MVKAHPYIAHLPEINELLNASVGRAVEKAKKKKNIEEQKWLQYKECVDVNGIQVPDYETVRSGDCNYKLQLPHIAT